MRVAAAHQEEVAHGVAPHFVHQLAQGQVAPGAFGEPHLLAALHYRHHLMQDVLGIPGGDAHAQRLQADAHPRDRAVMVGALHVDRARKAPFPLVDVIGDVRHKVRIVAALLGPFPHHAVFVVAEVGGLEPERTVLLVCVSGRHQPAERLLHLARRVQRRLEEVHVEPDPERLEVAVLLLAQLLHREAPYRVEVSPLRIFRVPGAVALADLADVLPVVAALRQLGRLPAQLADPGLHAVRQIHDLGAAIVVIKFPGHAPAGPFEQGGDGVAQGGLPAVPHVQRAGRIRRDELDVHGLPGAPPSPVAAAVPLARREHRGDHGRKLRLREEEIDESRPGHGDLTHQPLRQLERRDQPLRHGAGLLFERLGERERQIGRDITVGGVARALQLDRGRGHGRTQPRRRRRQRRADRLVRPHLSPEGFFFLVLSGFDSAAGFASGLDSGLDSGFDSGFDPSADSGFPAPARL